jgi:hypothetical protein
VPAAEDQHHVCVCDRGTTGVPAAAALPGPVAPPFWCHTRGASQELLHAATSALALAEPHLWQQYVVSQALVNIDKSMCEFAALGQ